MSNKNKTSGDNDPSKIPSVGWYDPIQLIDTAKRVTESDTFSRNADRRITYTEWENNPKPIFFKIGGKQEEAKIEFERNEFFIGSNRKNKDANPDGENEIWIDFIADTGDSGNATYTVAKTLFEESLPVTYHKLLAENNPIRKRFPKGLPQPLPRADLLILGGDLVYPSANEEAYKNRFIDIFKVALPVKENERDEQPDFKKLFRAVVAFPQNHDWYDNLSSFTLLFSHKEKKTFLDMKCPQSQSYAAVKLPHDWWLFGLDFGLSDDIDVFQFEYFKKITNDLSEKSRIIIEFCEPVWRTTVLAGKVKNSDWCYRYEKLERIIEKKTNRPIDIRLSGDQHHYSRYTSKTGNNNSNESESHLITCGCGGAFLHPTHGPAEFETIHHIRKEDGNLRTYNFSEDDFNNLSPKEKTKYKKEQDYPSSEESWKLSFLNFGFLLKNKKFGVITAFSYLLIVWANFSSLFSNIKTADFEKTNRFEEICYKLPIQWDHNDLSLFDNLSCAWRLWSWSTILSPLNGIIFFFVIFGFIYFAREFNSHAKVWATILGFFHGCAHFFAIFIIYFLVLLWLNRDPINTPLGFIHFAKTGTYILFLGWLFGSTIMGIYLFTTLNIYRRRVAIWALTGVLIYSFLVFAMWFNVFVSTLIIVSAALLVAFIRYKAVPLFEKEILFLHSNEAFSSLRVQEYKGFLRFKITKDRLEAFFIGIDKIPEKWKKEEEPELAAPKWKATDKNITPKLVDYWTVETPPKSNSQSS